VGLAGRVGGPRIVGMTLCTTPIHRTRRVAARVLSGWLLLSAAAHAGSCDVIKPQVEAKLRAGGLSHFTVTVEDAGQAKLGRVVGTCDLGTRRLVYVQHATAAGAAAAAGGAAGPGAVVTRAAGAASAAGASSAAGATNAASAASAVPAPLPERAARSPAPGDSIPTECKDGSIVIGPDCDDPRAPRMTAAELAKPASAP